VVQHLGGEHAFVGRHVFGALALDLLAGWAASTRRGNVATIAA
jgi:hypothetical protein